MKNTMKNTFLKTIGTAALAFLMLAMFALTSTSAQEISDEGKNDGHSQDKSFAQGDGARALEGTWNVQITLRNCQNNAAIRTFPALTTFMFGGTMIGSESAVSQALHTPGHGVWSHTGGREFKVSFKSFNFDAGGNFTGWTIIRLFALVNPRGTGYESFGNAEVYAPNGNLLFTGCSTTTATRFE
ncbi:MAG: hypothetical protein H0U50_07995 [Pyrinomonadaceae bacterium]|nr:hypothetical protein [Pyrinomonadaceae bacterium]